MAVLTKSCAIAREPLYLQVCELLARRIATGIWKPNNTLPNEVELARELGVSSGTVRKALEKLEAGRLVVRRQGRGTFVIDQTAPEAISRFDRLRQPDGTPIVWRGKLLRQSGGLPTPAEQKMLRINADEPVTRRRRLLSSPDRLLAIEDACLALSRLPGARAETVGDWNLTALAQRHGVHVTTAVEQLRLVAAVPETAMLLAIEAGAALMQLDRVTSSSDGSPIEWRSAACRLKNEYYLAEVR